MLDLIKSSGIKFFRDQEYFKHEKILKNFNLHLGYI